MTLKEFDEADTKFRIGNRLTDTEVLGLLSCYEKAYDALTFLNKMEYKLVLLNIQDTFFRLQSYATNRRLLK